MNTARNSLLPFVLVFVLLGIFFVMMERRIGNQSRNAHIIKVGNFGFDIESSSPAPKSDSVMSIANELLLRGKDSAAIDLLSGFVAQAPDSLRPSLWVQAGKILLQSDKDSLALIAFKNAVAGKNPPREANLWLAIAQNGNGTSGIDRLSRMLVLAPDNAAGWFRLGVLQRRGGDLESAAKSWRKALDIFPGFKDAQFNLAIMEMGKKNWKEAQQGFSDLVRAYPWKPEYHLNLAQCLSETGKRKEALAEYHRAIARRGGNYPEAWSGMAVVFRGLKLDDSARYALHRALDLRPESPEARYNLGIQYLGSDQLDSAAQEFSAAATSNPGYKEAWYNLGVVMARSHRPDSAVSAYRRALALDQSYTKARVGLAIRLEDLERHTEALSVYRAGIRLDTANAEFWFGAGLILRRMDSLPQSILAYRKCLVLAPDNDKAINNLGMALALSGKRQDAAILLRDGMSRFPDNVSIRYNLAIQESKLGHASQALALLESVRRLQPRHAGALRLFGEILASQGKAKEAREMYAKSLVIEPGNTEAESALAQLRNQ